MRIVGITIIVEIRIRVESYRKGLQLQVNVVASIEMWFAECQ